MKVTFVLIHSALELIPERLRNHRLIRHEWKQNLKKKKRGVLLDVAAHGPLLENLEDSNQRGRPDIIHHSLLNLMYSPLFKSSEVEAIIHTRNDYCINIPSNWRVPVNYSRFCGLFAQLLWNKRVPLTGDPLLQVNTCTFEDLLQKFQNNQIFLCESINFNTNINLNIEYLHNISFDKSLVFLIGAFQSGQLPQKVIKIIKNYSSVQLLPLYKDVMPTWIIVSKLIHYLEEMRTNGC
ncbi:MAG: hypothetical protein ACTSPG_00110 [Candidatus Hodarchaeales archaeon]